MRCHSRRSFSDPLGDLDVDQCSRAVHRELRNRFFDWFHQIEKLEHRSDYRGNLHSDVASFFFTLSCVAPRNGCHPAVAYMFNHFDTTNDSQLNDDELNGIEHLQNESCTGAFFERCDRDNDHRLFPDEWCECFRAARKRSNVLLLVMTLLLRRSSVAVCFVQSGSRSSLLESIDRRSLSTAVPTGWVLCRAAMQHAHSPTMLVCR